MTVTIPKRGTVPQALWQSCPCTPGVRHAVGVHARPVISPWARLAMQGELRPAAHGARAYSMTRKGRE
jgi:hypothetical protein